MVGDGWARFGTPSGGEVVRSVARDLAGSPVLCGRLAEVAVHVLIAECDEVARDVSSNVTAAAR